MCRGLTRLDTASLTLPPPHSCSRKYLTKHKARVRGRECVEVADDEAINHANRIQKIIRSESDPKLRAPFAVKPLEPSAYRTFKQIQPIAGAQFRQ